jgi:hypothetical protein
VDGWQRLYVHYAAEKNNGEEPIELPEIEEAQEDGISCIASSGARLYVAIGRKILCSDDSGGNWRIFPCDGLNGTINYIAASAQGADRLYCATTKGVFEFVQDKGRWLELYKGIDKAISVNKLIFGGPKDAHLWAVTDRGLYRMEIGKYQEGQYIDVEKNLKSFKVVYSNEPTFKELQHAAMKFAEVDPEKIRNWRSESRLRALLPKVSFGIDKDSSTNSEIYTSATKDYIIMGPDDVTSGLDLSVSWELGDLIWSDDQTNIDVRSRLTTQLRNDILDDLRRAYFERRRLQFEMIQSPPKDINALFEKELRIEELTQAIDDLTGNYLSEHSKNMP